MSTTRSTTQLPSNVQQMSAQETKCNKPVCRNTTWGLHCLQGNIKLLKPTFLHGLEGVLSNRHVCLLVSEWFLAFKSCSLCQMIYCVKWFGFCLQTHTRNIKLRRCFISEMEFRFSALAYQHLLPVFFFFFKFSINCLNCEIAVNCQNGVHKDVLVLVLHSRRYTHYCNAFQFFQV